MGKEVDDWGKPLGGDDSAPASPVPYKKPRRDSLTGLVYYFRDTIQPPSKLVANSPINGPALTKAFKKLLAQNYTHEQIREMIRVYASDLARKPLREGVQPWRGFLANLSELAVRTTRKVGHGNYDDVITDRRIPTSSETPPTSEM